MFDRETFRRRHLPHWDVPHAEYFVTGCLDGSIPARGLLDIQRLERELHDRPRPEGMSETDWQLNCWKMMFARADQWLDQALAVRHLADPTMASIVKDSMYHFAGERYDLIAYVVMPSHFHWLFRPIEAWVKSLGPDAAIRTPRERIMHGLKRFTASECNRRLRLSGPFWQQESYDHWVRSPEELERIIHYIEWNPVKAKLATSPVDYKFSSAHDRQIAGIPFGVSLVRPRS